MLCILLYLFSSNGGQIKYFFNNNNNDHQIQTIEIINCIIYFLLLNGGKEHACTHVVLNYNNQFSSHSFNTLMIMAVSELIFFRSGFC